MAYDAARGVTVLFGGYDGTYSGETWEWDGTAWTQRMVSGPSGRYLHAMAYDAARGVTVLFGGERYSQINNETWEWNGTVWTQRVLGGPSARWGHALAYDTARGVTVLVGGHSIAVGLNAETWELRMSCYANCDGSQAAPVLNISDFNCFLNRFAAGSPYANCDASTAPPVLNVQDFSCFLNRFATGCP